MFNNPVNFIDPSGYENKRVEVSLIGEPQPYDSRIDYLLDKDYSSATEQPVSPWSSQSPIGQCYNFVRANTGSITGLSNSPIQYADVRGEAGNFKNAWDIVRYNFVYTINNFHTIIWGELKETFYWPENHPIETIFIFLAGQAQFGTKPVIGKISDLNRPGMLNPGEYRFQWQNQGSPKANFRINSRLLRKAMQKRIPIRDVTVKPDTGHLKNNTGFLRAERNLLKNRGWTYNAKTQYWEPPFD